MMNEKNILFAKIGLVAVLGGLLFFGIRTSLKPLQGPAGYSGDIAQPYQVTTGGVASHSATTTEFIGNVTPDRTAVYDLGSPSKSWRNIYVSGTIDGLSVGSSSTLLGDTNTWSGRDTFNGGLLWANATGTNTTTTALSVSTYLNLPANSVTDAFVVNALTISGGTVDNSPIGNSSASTGIFSNTTSTNTTTTGLAVLGSLYVTTTDPLAQSISLQFHNTLYQYEPVTFIFNPTTQGIVSSANQIGMDYLNRFRINYPDSQNFYIGPGGYAAWAFGGIAAAPTLTSYGTFTQNATSTMATSTFTGNVIQQAGFQTNRKAINTSTYTATTLDDYLAVSSTGQAVTITLPAITAGTCQEYVIKDRNRTSALRNITISPNAANTIDGAASFVMNINGQSITLDSDCTSNWEIN